ncbi:MAG: hypothetical protein M3442_01975, partial [Chloroflexota bacterium]|nr:hypothetical protein [Chloroflexota bacterium]
AMLAIAREAREQPEVFHEAPSSTPIGRLDEVRAARQPDLRWKGGVTRPAAETLAEAQHEAAVQGRY